MAKLQSSTIEERKPLEEFEGNMKVERRPEGSADSFRSSQNRSRWQYASADKVAPKLILSALECMTHFKIDTEPTPRRESGKLRMRVDSAEQPSICLRSSGLGKSRTEQQGIQDQLYELGIPDALIEAAAKSDPQGLLLFDDLLDQTQPAAGHADQTPTEQSST